VDAVAVDDLRILALLRECGGGRCEVGECHHRGDGGETEGGFRSGHGHLLIKVCQAGVSYYAGERRSVTRCYQRMSRGPNSAPAPAASKMPRLYHVSTKIAETSG